MGQNKPISSGMDTQMLRCMMSKLLARLYNKKTPNTYLLLPL